MSGEKIFVIGDIHGCLDMLKGLIDKIEWNPANDRLIFIGDYIDRGENSKGVVDFLLKLKKDSSLIQCLIGNHEQMFLDYLSGVDSQSSLLNGGLSTLKSYEEVRRSQDDALIPSSHLDFYSSLLSMIELEQYCIVHAGFRPNISIEDQDLNDMIWIREEFIYSNYDFGKVVIFGHTPLNSPLIMKNKIGIDTGAVFGNYLTCLELPEEKFHSVRPK
ncbi:MAG: serine/threonine protein phosphatase [Deltaproteobacteria bacterium]|nr:MAG: serine/threonine protein phosphatase [Deltaproteobacteria bacterium]